jgi:hypothetical protein
VEPAAFVFMVDSHNFEDAKSQTPGIYSVSHALCHGLIKYSPLIQFHGDPIKQTLDAFSSRCNVPQKLIIEINENQMCC